MRILLVRLSALGDILRVLPSLHALRRAWPRAHITWLCQPMAADLLEGHPEVDEWLYFPRREPLQWPSFAAALREEERFDLALDFHGRLKSAVLTRLAPAKRRIGLRPPASRERAHWFYGEALPCPEENRVEQGFRLLRHLGVKPDGNWVLPLKDEARAWAKDWAGKELDGGPYAVLFTGSSTSRYGSAKQWSAENFAALGRRLHGEAGLSIVLPHGPGEEPRARHIASLIGKDAHVPPAMPLSRLAALIAGASLYAGGDTGPTHLAWLLRTPTVALFLASPMERNRAPEGLPYRGLVLAEPDKPADVDSVLGACLSLLEKC